MPKASDLKRGNVVELRGVPHVVKLVDCKSPSSRGAQTLYKIRFNNLATGQKLDESFKADEFIKDADCQKIQVQYSYKDGEELVFMNMDDYSQYNINEADLEGQLEFIYEGLEGITLLLSDDKVLGIELPQTIEMEIIETDPSIKGASATGRTKPARFATGLEIQVPEYLESGEKVKINTANSKFMSRVQETTDE